MATGKVKIKVLMVLKNRNVSFSYLFLFWVGYLKMNTRVANRTLIHSRLVKKNSLEWISVRWATLLFIFKYPTGSTQF